MQVDLEQLPQHLKDEISRLITETQRIKIENLMLREQLRLLRIEKYGPRSEKLSDHQLELLEIEPSVVQAEVEQEADQPAESKPPARKPRGKPPGRVRTSGSFGTS